MVGEGYCKRELWSLNITSFLHCFCPQGECTTTRLQPVSSRSPAANVSLVMFGRSVISCWCSLMTTSPVPKLPDVSMNNWSAAFCRDIWSPFLLSLPYPTTDLSSAPTVCSNRGSVQWSWSTSAPPGQLRRFDAEHPGQGSSAQWNTYVTHKFAWHLALLLALLAEEQKVDGEEWNPAQKHAIKVDDRNIA